MSRNTLLVAGLALLLAIGALVLQFALPSEGGVSDSEFSALRNEVAALRQQGGALRIAYMNAEAAFTVFTDAVTDMRQRASDKAAEIVQLQQQFVQSTISREDFEQQLIGLKAEFLDAQFAVQVAMIDTMVAAAGFADIRGELTALKEEAQPVIDEMKNLLSTARIGVIDSAEFDSRYSQLESAYQQLDQLLVSAATVKVVKAVEEIAVDRGYDLVIRTKNVIMYRNAATLVDITDLVKARLRTYL
jgi:Skp family chaperone for outer membrane proteins